MKKMKKPMTSLIAISLLCLLSVGATAYDKNLKEHMTFTEDLLVGNTIVKKGDYLVRYNAETSEVSIMEGKKVVVTAMATVIVNDKKFDHDALITKGDKLIGLRFGGQREELALTEPVTNFEVIPICYWDMIPISDDMEEIVISEVDGILPDAEIVNYRLVCRPWF